MNSVIAPLAYGGSLTLWSHLVKANEIVIEKNDHYQKQTQRNRLYIHGANGKLLLSIPIKHLGTSGHQKYDSVAIDNSFSWQSQHWKSLQTAYRSSPYFEFYEDDIAPLYNNSFTHLFDFNRAMFRILIRLLGISIPVTFTEQFEPNTPHVDLRSLVDVKQQKLKARIEYTQVFADKNGFIDDLCLLDLLFNTGPQSANLLRTVAN